MSNASTRAPGIDEPKLLMTMSGVFAPSVANSARRVARDLVVSRRAAEDPHVPPRVERETVGAERVRRHERGREPGAADAGRVIAEHRRRRRVVAGAQPQQAAGLHQRVIHGDDCRLARAHARRLGRHRRLVRRAKGRFVPREVVGPHVMRAGGQGHVAVDGDLVGAGRQNRQALGEPRADEPERQRAGGAAGRAASAAARTARARAAAPSASPPPQAADKTRTETTTGTNKRRCSLGIRPSSTVDAKTFSSSQRVRVRARRRAA